MCPPEDQPRAQIVVWLSPGTSRNEVTGLINGAWRVKITAPPVDGRANEMLLEFLSGKLGIKRNRLALIRGFTSRHKTVSIAGLDAKEVAKRLESPPG
jgi:uncharacterized protein (TIGR00251 family)